LLSNVKHEAFKIPSLRINFTGEDPHADHTVYDHPAHHHSVPKEMEHIGFLHSTVKHTTSLTGFDPKVNGLFTQFTNKLRTHRRGYTTASRDILRVVEELQNGQRSYKMSVPVKEKEKIVFSFRGDQTIKNLLSDIKEEDPSVRSLSLHSKDGERFSQTTRLEDVVRQPVELEINGKKFTLEFNPAQGRAGAVVPAQNFGSLPITLEELEQMKEEFLQLYSQKRELDNSAKRFGNIVIYTGLISLCIQWAIMARFTWWEFNWDIMEPITYFIKFGTGVLGYIYFTFTKREYTFGDLRDSVIHNRMFRNYIKNNFDVDRYFLLEHRLQRYDVDFLESVDTHLDEQQSKRKELMNTQPA